MNLSEGRVSREANKKNGHTPPSHFSWLELFIINIMRGTVANIVIIIVIIIIIVVCVGVVE